MGTQTFLSFFLFAIFSFLLNFTSYFLLKKICCFPFWFSFSLSPLKAENPMNLLTEEMKSDEPEIRINAMKRLRTISRVLGPERTRAELIPYINGEFSFAFLWAPPPKKKERKGTSFFLIVFHINPNTMLSGSKKKGGGISVIYQFSSSFSTWQLQKGENEASF